MLAASDVRSVIERYSRPLHSFLVIKNAAPLRQEHTKKQHQSSCVLQYWEDKAYPMEDDYGYSEARYTDAPSDSHYSATDTVQRARLPGQTSTLVLFLA